MTKRERVICALTHKMPDEVPYFVDFTHQAREKMVHYTGDENFDEKTGSHIKFIQYCGWAAPVEGRPDYFVDDFRVVWNRSGADKDIGVVETLQIPDLEENSYTFPLLDENRLRKEYENFTKENTGCFLLGGIGFSLYERAWSLCGIENVLMAMLTSEEELGKLLDDICDYNLQILDIILQYDIDGVYFGDDWGQQHGLIMGAELWRKFIKPRVKRMYEKVKQAGKFVIQHSCGDIYEIYPDLIEIGLDCHQTFQPEIYDIGKVKKEYGDRLSFWGGISTQQLLPNATPEEVKSETIRIMNIMKQNGGFIAAPTHDVPGDVPPQNILAMLEVFQNQTCWL